MTTAVEFVKIHGSGNDFVLVRSGELPTDLSLVRAICDRNRGVGADGVLFYQDSPPKMTVINADGSRPEMCGNGLRCIARWLAKENGLEPVLVIETDAGDRRCFVNVENGEVRINMGKAVVSDPIDVEFGGQVWSGYPVDMGNPHFVVFEAIGPEFDELGRALNDAHPLFPHGVNLEFVSVKNNELDVTVYERGVGRTLACGTGACAVAAAFWQRGVSSSSRVNLPGGTLLIEQEGDEVWMTGPTELVYRGALEASWIERFLS